MTSTTRPTECSAPTGSLLMVLELGRRQWKLGFTTGMGQRTRRRTLAAATWSRVGDAIADAKRRFGLAPDAPVVCAYEAGPDGFWIQRYLTQRGVRTLVVDSSSIEVSRRARRAKSDGLDVVKLLALLVRHCAGDPRALRVVRVPTDAEEDARQWDRELLTLKRDRTRVTNRIGGLLATQGVMLAVRAGFGEQVEAARRWNGEPIPPLLRARLAREWTKVQLLTTQITTLERARRQRLREADAGDRVVASVRRLLRVRGVGEQSAWLLVLELYSWRELRNRRQVGALSGLTSTPYQSGQRDQEQGIGKAGNAAVRAMAIELAWCWLRFQPQSALAQWYAVRFARGGRRARKIGIVAVARRLVIDLWRYLEAGVIPDGAVLKLMATR
jgi:transposase